MNMAPTRAALALTVILTGLLLCPSGHGGIAVPLEATEADEGPTRGSIASLGIGGLECKCSLTVQGDGRERSWVFGSEPLITKIRPDGPASGKLEAGDVLVAIDGYLITTREGGRRFGNSPPGEPVELTVRRGNRLVREIIVPVVPDPSEPVEVKGTEGSLPESLVGLSRSLEVLARVVPVLETKDVTIDLSELVDLPEPLSLPGLTDLDLRPIGYLGISLSLSGRIQQSSADDEPPRWDFDAPPEVHSVDPGGPADRAGLRKGDVLTHVDGVALVSEEGGRRFADIRPGQTVRWTVRRRGRTRSVDMVAEERRE